jgi:hypothetical protein
VSRDAKTFIALAVLTVVLYILLYVALAQGL